MESQKITQQKAAGQPQPFIEGEALQQWKDKVEHWRTDATEALSQFRSEASNAFTAVKQDYKRARASMHRLYDHSALVSFLNERLHRPAAKNARPALRNRRGR